MTEFELKYGCNPNQKPSKIYMKDGSELPIEILSGRPGYPSKAEGARAALPITRLDGEGMKTEALFLLV